MSVRIGNGTFDCDLKSATNFCRSGMMATIWPPSAAIILVRLRQRIDVDAAVGTPMPAMKRDRDRPLRQQLVEADQVPGVVRQDERRHRLARRVAPHRRRHVGEAVPPADLPRQQSPAAVVSRRRRKARSCSFSEASMSRTRLNASSKLSPPTLAFIRALRWVGSRHQRSSE